MLSSVFISQVHGKYLNKHFIQQHFHGFTIWKKLPGKDMPNQVTVQEINRKDLFADIVRNIFAVHLTNQIGPMHINFESILLSLTHVSYWNLKHVLQVMIFSY